MALSHTKIDGLSRALTTEEWELFTEHLRCGTSANWLSSELKAAGYDISPTTIKSYRTKLRGER